MKNRQAWLTLVGLVIGVIGTYRMTQAYRKAKTNCPPFRRRIYSDHQEMIGAFRVLWDHPEHLYALRQEGCLPAPLAEKIMLAVTGVNGLRASNDVQARHALEWGLAPQEVESLLRGEITYATADEAPALSFAQHYAARRDEPDPDMVQRLVDTYGPQMARDLITYIRLVTIGNLVGNTLDALLSRILGQPSPESTLRAELSTLGVFIFGAVPLVPVLIWRAARTASPRA
jgi:hypothetical protein